jgi:crotonobetainyl-CoA:carnitine CoA-transferase CaiB-like acyl-CoA transferase
LWKRFTQLLGAEKSLGCDPRFSSNQLRIANRGELIPAIQSILDSDTSEAWVKRFAAAEIPAAAIHTVPEALTDAQTLARGLIIEIEHPLLGAVRSVANPIRLSSTPVSYRLPPPFLGEHTAQILSELSYSSEEIEKAQQECAI